jgi:ribonuclease BN (tRNA processing enzyme)
LTGGLRIGVFVVLVAIVVGMWGATFVSKRVERVAAGIAALPPRDFEALSLVALGTGGPFENPWRLGPALAVGLGRELVLVDAGRGVAEALRRAEIPVHQPRTLLLTSLLPENTLGLDDLWLTGWLGPREAPLRVVGPPGTRRLVETLRDAHAAGRDALGAAWELPAAGARIEVEELPAGGGPVALAGGLGARAAPLGGAALPTFAFRFEGGGRGLVVAPSGADEEALAALAAGADLLALEAIYGASLEAAAGSGVERADVIAREAEGHLRLEAVGALARRAGVRTLVLTRLRPPPVFAFQYQRLVAGTFPGRVVIAADGDVVTP